jgi:hypothetical protein
VTATHAPKRRIGQSWGLGRFLFLIAFTVGLASLGIWQVHRQYQVIAGGYAVDRDLFEVRRLLERQKRLSLLLAAYKDPTALRIFAEEELGMSAPPRDAELFSPDPHEAALSGARPTPDAPGAAAPEEGAP